MLRPFVSFLAFIVFVYMLNIFVRLVIIVGVRFFSSLISFFSFSISFFPFISFLLFLEAILDEDFSRLCCFFVKQFLGLVRMKLGSLWICVLLFLQEMPELVLALFPPLQHLAYGVLNLVLCFYGCEVSSAALCGWYSKLLKF